LTGESDPERGLLAAEDLCRGAIGVTTGADGFLWREGKETCHQPGFIVAAATVTSETAPVLTVGDLDLLNLNITGSYVMATAVQPDGKTIIAGSFSSVLGQARGNIARLNADGSLDAGFDPKANGEVACVAVQADGKILLGGLFTTLQPNGAVIATSRSRIARLNADGSLDTGFDPNASSAVRSVALQTDGKILLGGGFTSLKPNGAASATSRSRIARLNVDGTLDTGFDPKANGEVASVVVQADGRILLGGVFTTLQPNGAASVTSRNRIARVYADGTLDTGFDPKASNTVSSVAVQADGRILLGGTFTSLQPNGAASPTLRNCIARVYADGTLDTGFDPKASNAVNSMAVQADGRILLVGSFTTLQPNGAASATSRNRIARVFADGTLDTGFDPKADNVVYSVAVQADGKILLGGFFTNLQPNGAASATARHKIARLVNDPATQTLSAVDTTQVSWTRGGSSPEVSQVTFEKSTDSGVTWTLLGSASRVGSTSNWRLSGQSLPASGLLRARGRTTQGYQNGGSGLIEQVASFSGLVIPPDIINGSTVGHALWNRPDDNGTGVPNHLSTLATATPYEAVAFSVSNTGLYTLTVTSISPSGWDNYLMLYTTVFNPATPLVNVLVGDDDGGPGLDAQVSQTLQAGVQYYAVVSGYTNSSTGSYRLELQGPGDFSKEPTLAVEQPAGSGITSGGLVYYDNVTVGTTDSKIFTLRNIGDGGLTVLNVTLDGADANQFNLPSPPVNQVIGTNGIYTFNVEFKPTSAGRKTATLHINNSDPLHNPYDIILSGNGLPDIIVEQPAGTALTAGVSSRNFGTLTTGGTSTLSFTVRNAGFSTLSGLAASVTGAASGDFTPSSLGTTTLPPGGSTTFNVSFSPGAVGTRTATLHIASNDATKNPFDVALSGIGNATSEFASTTVGRPSWNRPSANGNAAPVSMSGVVAPYDTIGFTVTSSGTYTLTSTATNPVGWDTYLFLYSIAFNAAAPLNQVLIGDDDSAGGYNSQFSYTLQAGTTYYAVVTAYGRDQAGDYTLRISGPGNVNVVPNMAVIDQLGVNIPDGGNSYMTSVAVGGSTSHTYTLRNYGYTDLAGLGMTLDGANAGAFSITTLPAAPVAGPNGSTTFVIIFSPTSAGTKHAALHITSNDPNKTPFDIFLTGNGTPFIAIEQPVNVGLTDMGSLVPYGSVLVGNSKLLTFTIRSVGTAALSVIGSTIDGANAGDFSVQNLTPGLLAPGTSSTFRVLFAPSATGSRNATLHLTSNDPLAASFDIALTGTGAPRTPAIDVGVFNDGYGLTSGISTVSFGSPLLGNSSVRTFFIRNYGTADLTGLTASTGGAHAAEFSVGALSSAPLTPYDGRILEVTFTPTAAGIRTAVLHITSNDPVHSSFDINLIGNNSDSTSDLPRTTVGCPTWNRPDANGTGVPSVLSTPATATPYDVVSFTVNTTGEYTFRCTGTTPLDWNVFLILYRDAFDPSNPLQNVVIGDDDSAGGRAAGFTVTLQAGTRYFIVITGGDNASYGLY
ncbi:MAG: choice-of-anchor D domain-containing protein, partial [Prosthecobacter sp.]